MTKKVAKRGPAKKEEVSKEKDVVAYLIGDQDESPVIQSFRTKEELIGLLTEWLKDFDEDEKSIQKDLLDELEFYTIDSDANLEPITIRLVTTKSFVIEE